MNANELQINSVVVKQVPRFKPGGSIGTDFHVSYMVGTHGPFLLVYPDAMPGADKVRGDMDAMMLQLRTITSY